MTENLPSHFSQLMALIPFKRILAVFSIACTVLYLVCWAGEALDATREKLEGPHPHAEVPQKPLADRIKENLQRQIAEIQQVDAQDLGFTFLYDLKMWECNWRFHCVPSKAAVEYAQHDLMFGHGVGQRYLSLLQERATVGLPEANRSFLSTQSLSPGLIQPSGGAEQHSLGIPDPKRNGTTAATPAASAAKSLNPSERLSIAERDALVAAALASPNRATKQPQKPSADNADLEAQLALLPKAQPSAEIRNPASDEPPSPDERSFAFNSAEPKLLVKGPIPTLHTVLGTPRATFVTIKAILKAGPWAITIFIACGVLYFGVGVPLISVLLRDKGQKTGDKVPLILIVLLLVSPVADPILVEGVQWGATQVGNALVGLWVMVATWSAAISVVVGIPHVWKSPREVKEAYHVVRHGVETIEKK